MQSVHVDWKPDAGSPVPLYLQIVFHVRERIASGSWPAGSRLPSQRRLSEWFSVNRSTVVAAMDELRSYGLLETDHGGGTVVADNTWALLMHSHTPDWDRYAREGLFHANNPTIQLINSLEFDGYTRLGTGEPSPSLFPRAMMEQVLSNVGRSLQSLNYLEPLGLMELRTAVSRRLARKGLEIPPSCILITSGSLQALQLLSMSMLKKGSTVFVETPGYLQSLQVFQSAGMKLHGIPMDGEGLRYWQMERKGSDDCLLYTIPTFQNPTGILMSGRRREGLFRFCLEHRIPIIEDDAYGELWLDEKPPQPLKAMDGHGLVLYLGTVSKTLAPGLRVGWMAGPEAVVRRLGDIKMQVDYGASSLSQWVVTEFLESGLYDSHLDHVRSELRMRRNHALDVLKRYFGTIATWDVPHGGFYIWLRLAKNRSPDMVFRDALAHRILLNPGTIYDDRKNHALRISYAYEDSRAFESAMRELAGLL